MQKKRNVRGLATLSTEKSFFGLAPRVVPILTLFLATVSSFCHAQTSKWESLGSELLFHASFDRSTTADFSKGNPALFEASSIETRSSAEEFSSASTTATLQSADGRFGGCLTFEQPVKNVVFYKVQNNFPVPSESGTGTVAFWLRTDPASELREGFCDPIQITSKQWDDASFFVEFEKRGTRVPFRLGVYADRKVWNPDGRDFGSIPPQERPLTAVDNPPFQKGKWIHVAFSFANFNSDQPTGTASLYLEGNLAGTIASRRQFFTWDIEQAAMMLGLSYVGSMDDLAVFNRALTAEEIKTLYSLPNGVRDLKPVRNQ